MALAFDILGVIAAFALGAFVGNFYHLIVHRLPGGRFRVTLPPSCPACGRAERRIWTLPLAWFLILRGRCPHCDYRYRRDVLVMEGLGGVFAALLFYYYGPTPGFAATFLFCCFFFLNYVVEFRYGVLVPQLYFPALVVGFAVSFLPGEPSPVSAVAGGLVPGAFVLIISVMKRRPDASERGLRRQFGVLALAGVFLGWQSAVFALAATAAVAWAATRVRARFLPREPATVFALAVPVVTLVLMFFRADITAWYFRLR